MDPLVEPATLLHRVIGAAQPVEVLGAADLERFVSSLQAIARSGRPVKPGCCSTYELAEPGPHRGVLALRVVEEELSAYSSTV